MVWLWSGLFFIKTLLSELVEVDRVLYDFRVTQGYLETWILSIQVLLVPSKYKKWREKEDFCLKGSQIKNELQWVLLKLGSHTAKKK